MVEATYMKHSEIFSWPISVEMRYFWAKSELQRSRYRDFTNFISPTKSQNFKFILDKSLLNEKVVFIHKNNSFLGFRTQKMILRGVLTKKHIFFNFHIGPLVFPSRQWTPHTSYFAWKCLKMTGIGKEKISESFV